MNACKCNSFVHRLRFTLMGRVVNLL